MKDVMVMFRIMPSEQCLDSKMRRVQKCNLSERTDLKRTRNEEATETMFTKME